MSRALLAAIAAVAAAGCASTPDSTAQRATDCQVASAEGGTNVVSNGTPRPQSEMAQRFARADLARSSYRLEHMNDNPSATEEAVRNCLNR